MEQLKLKNPSCELIVIDNFYNNANEVRKFILTQDFYVEGNFPGKRTKSFANQQIQEHIQKYIEPFGGKITDFPIPNSIENIEDNKIYNGAFQYTTSRDKSWVHIDGYNNWAGILFLTPDAPLNSGTGFYQFYDSTKNEEDMINNNSKSNIDRFSQDMTKWKLVDKIGNVFNRLVLFNSKRYHMSMDYFGDSLENGRLFQVFFFSTER
jgi:hypothetical protein